MTKDLARSFNLEEPAGAVVVSVEKGSPAERAGLRTGDVILAFGGKPIEDPNELPRLVAATAPGQQAQLEVWRNGKREQLSATVGEFASESDPTASRKPAAKEASDDLGLSVQELPPEGRKALGVEYGLIVSDVVGGPAARSPIQPGDVIVAVGQERFANMEEFKQLIARYKKGESVALLVRRGAGALFVPLEIGVG